MKEDRFTQENPCFLFLRMRVETNRVIKIYYLKSLKWRYSLIYKT